MNRTEPITDQAAFIAWDRANLEKALQACIEDGFQTPIHFSQMSVNGGVIARRCAADGTIDVLASSVPTEGWRMPTLLIVLDPRGRYAVFRMRELGGSLERVQ